MFKIGDKVVCIDVGKIQSDLNYNVIYTVEYIIKFSKVHKIKITNDSNNFYKIKRFISLKQYRKQKLYKLLCLNHLDQEIK